MAEDPGVGTLAAIIEALRQAANFMLDTTKSVVSLGMEFARMKMYSGYRRAPRQNQEPKLKHGYQSLKDLRLHEAHGAHIASVEVGTREDLAPLQKEIRQAKLDYALTRDSFGIYTLYYKTSNEQDIMKAQAKALQERFGEPIQESNRSEISEELDRHRQQNQQEMNQGTGQDLQNQTRSSTEQEQTQQASSQPTLHAQAPSRSYVQPEGGSQEHGRAEQAASIRMAKAEPATSRSPKAQSVSDAMTMEALFQKRQDETRGINPERIDEDVLVQDKVSSREQSQEGRLESSQGISQKPSVAVHSNSREPLESVIKEAKENAREKNRARNLNRERARDRMKTRNKNRIKTREFNMGR